MTMPSLTVWPHCEVPPPRGVTLIAASRQIASVRSASARTADSKEVTFEYDVNTPNLAPTLDFGVYRSADPTFDAGDRAIASISIATTSVGRSTVRRNQPSHGST